MNGYTELASLTGAAIANMMTTEQERDRCARGRLVQVNEECSTSYYRIPRSRYNPKKATKNRYGKHGTIATKPQSVTLICNTGVDYWHEFTPNSTYTELTSISTYFQQTPYAVVNQLYQVTMNPDFQVYGIAWEKCRYEISNANTHSVTITLFDYICKIENRMGPLAALQKCAVEEGDIRNNYGASFTNRDMLNCSEPGFDIWNTVEFHKIYKIVNVTKVHLKPGSYHVHETYRKPGICFSQRVYQDLGATAAEVPTYLRELTYGTLMKARGRIGRINTLPDTGAVITDGVKLDVLMEKQMYVWDAAPLGDYFTINLYNTWTGEGRNRTDLNIVEEDDPTDKPGT